MSQQFVETADVVMRRRVQAIASQQVVLSPGHGINVARISSRLTAPPPPATVPFEDPGSTCRVRGPRAHLRVLIRPAANIAAQTATYIGTANYIVRI